MMTVKQAIITTILMSLITFATRIFPFALFHKRKPPKALLSAEHMIPPAIMIILVIFCLKDTSFTTYPYGIPQISSVAAVVLLHLASKNAMTSIFGGTIIYIILLRVL